MVIKILVAIVLAVSINIAVNAQDQVYELRTYEMTFFGNANLLHNYLQNALIPALNRQGIEQIGVFEETSGGLPGKIYLLIPYENIAEFKSSSERLLEDSDYQTNAKDYLTADPGAMSYTGITTNLIQSATGFPKLAQPAESAQLFELRIYTAYNEDALRRKVKMFNDSEFGIFEEVELPMVFFGHNMAGDQMPCLTYMLAFDNMEAHGTAWTKFLDHPEWKRIVRLEEYANTVDEIYRYFLRPLSYSQL